ncbi:hypothetical protein F2Q70_00016431 [Brassica cretica]|uniref:Alpha-1,3/1,6-mannosyltransferase ALG2 n=1 Tax=Brassica cretica TaxID=69181 RepID=A0A8S9I0D4_BRACR|nr:hypothetical protein F2Q70_00016431 [Brassica cretica]
MALGVEATVEGATELPPDLKKLQEKEHVMSADEQAKAVVLQMQQNASEALKGISVKDTTGSVENGDEQVSEELESVSRLFSENVELKSYYEKNSEGGHFVCLVCCAATDKKMIKRFKHCHGLVLHSTKTPKIAIRAHKAFARFVCKLLGWEFDHLPRRLVKGGAPLVESSANQNTEKPSLMIEEHMNEDEVDVPQENNEPCVGKMQAQPNNTLFSSGSIFQVTVDGSFLPRHIFYRLHAVCAYLRCLFVALCVLLEWSSFDVVLADQVSVVVPLLKLKRSSKVVFYCHFPDLLLAKHTTVSAFAILCKHYQNRSDVTLTVAELKSLAEKEGVSDRVNFITSCSTAERNQLLSSCLCLLYTPTDEHFGIVPLEAMVAYKPVIACNSGGPMETVKNGVTGYLCEATPEDFSSAVGKFPREF